MSDLQKMSVEELVDKASMAMLYCHRTSVQDQSMRASLELARRNKLLVKALGVAKHLCRAHAEDVTFILEALKQNRGE